jgi:8-oxo-dGTP pyrophosphatase MutT (NUDIX family)
MPVSPQALDAARIRQELAATRIPGDPLAVSSALVRRILPAHMARDLRGNLRPAGVLVPIILRRDALSVLLTERASDLRNHAGQVSFPGGGMEEQDRDIAATALRETYEEVGIHPSEVDIAGFLRPTPTVTGYAVTPVIGLIAPTITLTVDPVEVEATFEVPLDYLMDRRNEEHSEREYNGVKVPVVTFHYGGYRIWGATAGILVQLREILIK